MILERKMEITTTTRQCNYYDRYAIPATPDMIIFHDFILSRDVLMQVDNMIVIHSLNDQDVEKL